MSARVPLVIDAGSPFIRAFQWVDGNSQPYQLADATFTAQIRARFLHEDPDADPVAVFVVEGDDEGGIHISLTDDETAAIPPGTYLWDLRVVDTDPPGRRLIHGPVTVTAAVTPTEQ